MKTFADVIEAFGVKAMCEILGLPDTHIRAMKARDSIPVRYWSTLIERGAKYGVPLDFKKLDRIRESRFERVAS